VEDAQGAVVLLDADARPIRRSLGGRRTRPELLFKIGHESRQPDLLKAAMPGLCTTCHSVTERKIVAAHGGIPIKNAVCTGCHEPHVSASAGLFHPVGHKPFLGKVCSACHK